jgi:hypothetical protein
MDKSLLNSIQEDGYAFIPGFRPEKDTEAVAIDIGVIEPNSYLSPIQQLQPKAKSANAPNLYSGSFGHERFPFHTDLAHWFLPPRYIVLRCIVGHALVKTPVLKWSNLVKQTNMSFVRRARVRLRRPRRGRFQLLPVLQKTGNGVIFRWDSLFLRPDNFEAFQIADLIGPGSIPATAISIKDPGDTLILDNWRVLHGRSSVPAEAFPRLIDRVYLRELKNYEC